MVIEAKEIAAGQATSLEAKQAEKPALKQESPGTTGTVGAVVNLPVQAWGLLESLFSGDFPAVDIIHREGELVIRAELPGVVKEDLQVTIGDHSLTIKGTIRRQQEEEKGDYIRREITRQGTFSRTLSLPIEVDAAKSKARFKDCMLELSLPKSAKLHTLKID